MKEVNISSSYYTKEVGRKGFNPYAEDKETIPTSPSLMEAATTFFNKSMGWLLYRVFLPPTMLLK